MPCWSTPAVCPASCTLTRPITPPPAPAEPYGFIRIVSMLAWGLGYFGMPHILVRFMAIRHEDELKLSRRIAASWVVISMAVAVFIGIVGHAVSAAGRIPSLEGSATETVIVRLSDLLSSYGILPAVVAGCILAGILAATMSTADSQLLAAASAFSENVLQDLFGVKLTPKQNMLAARLTVVVIAFIAIFLAADPNSNVFKIVSFAWAGFGATFGPAMLCALFWRRSNRQGIMAGLVVGGVMIFVWKFLVAPMGGMFNIYELLPRLPVCPVRHRRRLPPHPRSGEGDHRHVRQLQHLSAVPKRQNRSRADEPVWLACAAFSMSLFAHGGLVRGLSLLDLGALLFVLAAEQERRAAQQDHRAAPATAQMSPRGPPPGRRRYFAPAGDMA